MAKVMVGIRIEEDHKEFIKILAVKKKVSMQTIFNEIIEQFILERQKEQVKR